MQLFNRILCVILFVTSCNSLYAKGKNHQIQKDTLEHFLPIVSHAIVDTLLPVDDFFTFWKSFRNAVIDSDSNKIISMTKFPFQTRGPLDDDLIVKYNNRKFIHVFNAFLNQWNGRELNDTTEMDDIKKTLTPNKNYIQKDMARVGDLVFNKNAKGWKLVLAYLNNETIDALNR
jgi:hypothetical protein